jgi:hypothetical protein
MLCAARDVRAQDQKCLLDARSREATRLLLANCNSTEQQGGPEYQKIKANRKAHQRELI